MVKRIDFDKEQYGRIAFKAARDKNISGDPFHLLFTLLNNVDGWKIRLEYFANELGWGASRRKTATKKLIEHGYLIQTQIILSSGHKDWEYQVSELGDLNTGTIQPEAQEPPVKPSTKKVPPPQPEVREQPEDAHTLQDLNKSYMRQVREFVLQYPEKARRQIQSLIGETFNQEVKKMWSPDQVTRFIQDQAEKKKAAISNISNPKLKLEVLDARTNRKIQ
ncbi:hypothetical protein [Flaviaesturariibacter amylovorans]|uniref:Helix-turn-helix domain-containing protein n=1 Tax=Flaviaesturariibacter amylovorans TaxID=1084520 RepID=A0ABP8GKV5_9BACT